MCDISRWIVNDILFSWLAELGPMFFTIKDNNYSQRDKRKQDREDSMNMEDRMNRAIEQQKREEEMEIKAVATPRTKIATPGRRATTPMIRKRGLGL